MTETSPQQEQYSDAEIQRLEEIAALSLTAENDDPEVKALLEKMCSRFNLPLALVSIVTDGAQFFFEYHGLGGWIEETRGTPKEWSFCQFVVEDEASLTVEDAASNERVNSSPLIDNDGIMCYLGAPIRSKNGAVVGSLCVLGSEQRSFSAEDRAYVEACAAELTELLEKRREDS